MKQIRSKMLTKYSDNFYRKLRLKLFKTDAASDTYSYIRDNSLTITEQINGIYIPLSDLQTTLYTMKYARINF